MQGYVPLDMSAKRKKIKLFSILSFLLIAILIVFLVLLIPKQKDEKFFKQKSYFFVYATKSQKSGSLASMQDLLISLGGAGVTYSFNDNYFLIANVYVTDSDAEQIKNNILSTFNDAGVIEVKTKEVSAKKKNLIKDNEKVFNLVKFIYEFLDFYQTDLINYLSGTLTDSKLCSKLIEKKLELENIIEKLKQSEMSVLEKNAINVGEIILVHFNNFFNNFYISSKKESLATSLLVNITIERVNLFDNL